MKTRFPLLTWLAIVLSCGVASAPEPEEYLERFLDVLPDVPAFDAWLESTGELPPDFDSLPRINGLPDPLRFLDGRSVVTAEDWDARRAEIFVLEQEYDLGTFPPKPVLANIVVLGEETADGRITRACGSSSDPTGRARCARRSRFRRGRVRFPS